MENSLSFQKPINRYFRKVSLSDWFTSLDNYDDGNNLKSVIHLLRYINGPVPIPDGDSIELKIPHGSVYVYIKADNENFEVNLPFLKLNSSSKKLPAMRQFIEQNFSSLILGQIILKDNDELWYHYKDKIANCEPYKVYYTLDEICNQADNNDDYYIEKFQLEHVENPELNYFSQEDSDKAKSTMKSIIEEGLSYAEFFESKRWYNTACDSLAITYFRIK
ncbi:MAG: hypothetical protein KDK36_04705, partial [Leptospiraceae bacterium]|nr:hypothetical protein [Leptospiraceae bacterium]